MARGAHALRADQVIYPEDGSSHFRLWRDNVDISWMHTRLVCRLLWDGVRKLPAVPVRLWQQGRRHWSRTPKMGALRKVRRLVGLG